MRDALCLVPYDSRPGVVTRAVQPPAGEGERLPYDTTTVTQPPSDSGQDRKPGRGPARKAWAAAGAAALIAAGIVAANLSPVHQPPRNSHHSRGTVRVYSASGYLFRFSDGIAVGGSDIWVANDSSVTELNAGDGSLVRVLSGARYSFYDPDAIAAGAAEVWIASLGGHSMTEIPAG